MHGAFARLVRLHGLLLTTELDRLTVEELSIHCGLRPDNYARTISTAEVQEAMAARGWSETTRKAVGLRGKGKLLVRSS